MERLIKHNKSANALKNQYINLESDCAAHISHPNLCFVMSHQIGPHGLHLIGLAMNGDEWTHEQSAELMTSMDKDGDGMCSQQDFISFYRGVIYDAGDEGFEAGMSNFKATVKRLRQRCGLHGWHYAY